jgi:drug/metabolite transporter (DMT)-like permease
MTRSWQVNYGTGVMLAAIGALCWSFGGALVRLTEGLDAWQIIFYRSATLFVCMMGWLAIQHGRHLLLAFRQAGFNAVIAGLAIGMAGLTFIASLFYTTVAQSIFMTGLTPFIAALLGLWILREKVAAITWMAMVIALAGMLIILSAGGGQGSVIGTALAIYSAFCFSCYAVLLRWGQNTEMTVALVWNAVFLVLVSTFVMLVPTGLREMTPQPFMIGWSNFAACLALGSVQVTLGLALFTFGSRAVPAAQLSLIALIEPTFSPLWAWLVANEVPPLATFVGGAVILAAIAFQALMRVRQVKPA